MMKVVALLPEGKLFDLLYSEALAPAFSEAGGAVERLPAAFSTESQRQRLGNSLRAADLVIAELTGKNPNVMYLLGHAHALERRVLLLVQHLEDFPFESARHPAIGYAGDLAFLRRELKAFLSGGTVGMKTESESRVSDAAAEKFTAAFGDILTAHGFRHAGGIELENPTTFVLLNQEMDLALVQDLARRARELGLRLKLM